MAQQTATGNAIGYIICEETNTNVEFKVTGENKNGFVLAEGILQRANEINRNKRYYPVEELKRAISSPKQQELVRTGNFKGEAGHPLDKTLARQSKVDPQCEQVWYTKLWMEGDYVKGQFRGTNNDLGRSFNDDLKDGQLPSFSLRALGSLVNENGRMTVRNMQMVAYDRVYYPSHPSAYTQKIITTESAYSAEAIGRRIHEHEKNEQAVSLQEAGQGIYAPNMLIPMSQQEVNSFILTESTNLRRVINTFDIFYESMQYQPETNSVVMKTRLGDTINLSLEKAVAREIMNGICDIF